MNKIFYGNIRPNPKESKIWLNVNGQLATYNRNKQRWGILIQSNDKPEDLPDEPIIPDEPVVPEEPEVNPWEGIANGVYAMSVDGKPVDYDNADNNCIGAVFITDNQKIMFTKKYNNGGIWSNGLSGKDVAGVTNTVDASDAKKDFNGKANTAAILAAYEEYGLEPSGDDMCYKLNSLIDSDTYKDWYIPSAGQLYEIYMNKATINAMLTKINGGSVNGGALSSSEANGNLIWYVSMTSGSIGGAEKTSRGNLIFVRDVI